MNKAVEEIRNRFEALEPRERRFILAAVGVLVVTLVIVAIVQPLHRYRNDLAERVESERELVSWMRGAVDVLRARGPVAAAPVAGGSLLAMTDSSLRDAGLAQSIRRIQQEGDDAVRVRLESASFDQVMLWLESLKEGAGVIASEMSVERADGPGLVNVTLTLTRAGA